MAEAPDRRPAAWILTFPQTGHAEPRVFGLTAGERLRRSLLRFGVASIDLLPAGESTRGSTGPCVVLRDDHFYDERLLEGLLGAPDCVLFHETSARPGSGSAVAVAAHVDGADLDRAVALLSSTGEPDPGPLRRVGVLDLAPAYNSSLRKHDPPFVYEASPERLREVENRIFAASYKGITDLVTKWVFPKPARAVVRLLASRGVRPNAVTAVSYVLVLVATWLFVEGWFATGLALGWLMTFLDTVDGKLARCTLTSTQFGNIFDHGLDLIHPPIWWGAWVIGLPGGITGHAVAFWLVVGGYVVGRLLEAAFKASFGIQFFVWRPFDSAFRTVIARRNPNLILLTASVALGKPTWGLHAVAAWTVICIGIAAARNVQGHRAARAGVVIRPWMDELESQVAEHPSSGMRAASAK